MEIIVLIKQVPATESLIEIAADGKGIKTDTIKWVMNPYDELAVEEAIRIKETDGGAVTILSAGPDKAKEAIRSGLAMGADKGILINDPALAECDGIGIARALAAAIKPMTYDLIIAGQRAVDDDNAIVGQAVAEFLGIPAITLAISREIADGKIRCRRAIEGGVMTLEAPLPALITTQRGLNEPRYASLPGIMKAKKKPIDTRTLADLGLSAEALGAAKTKIRKLMPPPARSAGRMIEGDTPAAKARALVKALAEEAKVI